MGLGSQPIAGFLGLGSLVTTRGLLIFREENLPRARNSKRLLIHTWHKCEVSDESSDPSHGPAPSPAGFASGVATGTGP